MRYVLTFALLLLAMVSTTVLAAEPQQVTPPSIKKFVQAELPEDAAFKNVDVAVWLTIGVDGKVTKVEIKQGAGDPYDASALSAARQMLFNPAKVDGKPIVVRVPFTYKFRIPRRRGRMLPDARGRRGKEVAPGRVYVGTVVEKGTRSPLGGVAVIARDRRTKKEYQAVSEYDGRFVLEGLPPGKLNLQIVAPDYKDSNFKIAGTPFPKGTPVPASARTFYLAPTAFAKYKTVVKEKRRKEAASEITLSDDELTKIPGTFGDPTRVVATLPGVARSPFGLGYYVVRGASFDNTGFFIDGHPALFLYHLGGGPGIIHPLLVDQLRFYPGGYPANYGRFAGGAIAIETGDPPDDRWHLDFELDVFRASLLFSTPFDDKKGQVTFSIRQSYYDLLLPLIQDGVTLRYTDYQARIRYDITPELRWQFYVLGAEDLFAIENLSPGNNNQSSDQNFNIGFHRIRTSLIWAPDRDTQWENAIVWEIDRTNTRRVAEGDDDTSIGFLGWFLQWRSTVTHQATKQLKIGGGVDLLYLTLDADLRIGAGTPLGDPRPPIFNPTVANFGIIDDYLGVSPWLSMDWEPIKGLRFIPSVRFNIENWGGETALSLDPKFAVRAQVHPMVTLKGLVGIAHQPPSPAQTAQPFGNPYLPPITAYQSSIGAEIRPAKGWEITVEGFYNHFQNMVRPNSQLSTEDDTLSRGIWSADMSGRAYGVELLIRREFGDIAYGWISYTLSRSERKRPPADWTLFEVDQTHILNLAWTFVLPDEWSIGARFTLTSGNPYFAIIGSKYDSDRDRYEPLFAAAASRLPIFHRLDLRIDKRFRFDTFFIDVFLDVQNVYNQGNTEAPRYSYDYSIQSEGIALPTLGTIGFRMSF